MCFCLFYYILFIVIQWRVRAEVMQEELIISSYIQIKIIHNTKKVDSVVVLGMLDSYRKLKGPRFESHQMDNSKIWYDENFQGYENYKSYKNKLFLRISLWGHCS